MHRSPIRAASALGLVVVAALGASSLGAVAPANATPAGDNVVINELYAAGGSAGAPFTNKFVELYNPTNAAISLDGWSVQYRSATGTGAANGIAPLAGQIAAKGYYLVELGSNGASGAALPTPDVSAPGVNPAATNGVVFLANQSSAVTLPQGSIAGAAGVVDALGYGSATSFEGATAAALGGAKDQRSTERTNGVDTDNNQADFTRATPSPQNSGGTGSTTPPTTNPTETPAPTATPTPTATTPATMTRIADVQGTGDVSPFAGQNATTQGVVTAAYPNGGLKGFVIQMPGTVDVATHKASRGLFIYAPNDVANVKIGDSVEVSGVVSEYFGQTQIAASTVTKIAPLGEVSATPLNWTGDEATRESFESMLVTPKDKLVVTDNYGLNQYGEIGLAVNDLLVTPTEVGAPMSAEAKAQAADNVARGILLDDGASTKYTGNGSGTPTPYLDKDRPVTVGATATFTKPVVLSYGFNKWRLQPTAPVSGENPADEPATFNQVREAAPQFGGKDFTISTFNVLNYFTDLGVDNCTAGQNYKDREGNPITANNCKPRGAWDAKNFERQQAKIVAAINTMDADVIGLEEIEDSSDFGKDRDESIKALVAALNTAANSDKWAYVPSPAAIPATGNDVIRSGFIYQPASVKLNGTSEILDSADFKNARAPLAQSFTHIDSGKAFNVIVNHFKSKGGSGNGDNENLDKVNGPEGAVGGWNGDRTRQAAATVAFANAFAAKSGTDATFLVGDFNAYSMESPVTTITNAGFADLGHSKSSTTGLTEYSYLFGGTLGSLDHVFASASAKALVDGVDTWTINSYESIAYEYSRWNNNVESFYSPDQFRASDHNPEVVKLKLKGSNPKPSTGRIAGGSRYETSVETSKAYTQPGAPVFLVTGEKYADALAAGPAAATVDGALLLTLPNRLPEAVADEIKRLAPSTVYFIGTKDAISEAVEAEVKSLAPAATIERIGGDDRTETAALIASRFFPDASEALLATGWNFPDALSAAAAGSINDKPVLLTAPNTLSAPTEKFIASSKLAKVVVVGGTNSVSNEAAGAVLSAKKGVSLVRLQGANRYATNIALMRNEIDVKSVDAITISTGQSFPDALVASVVADRLNAPLVLTTGDCGVAETQTYLSELGEHTTVTLGGADRVKDGWHGKRCAG